MQLGITMFATDRAINPIELAKEAEDRGFASMWLPEHTHIPASRDSEWPGGGDLPTKYYRSFDPPTVLAACAQVTTTLRLGSGISLAAQHDPVSYAKVWATLDHMSSGRAVFGVGYGWNKEEMNTHGVEYTTRRRHVREHVMTMQSLWADEEAAFKGEFVNLEPSFAWPKPVQQPRIPTMIGGGAGPKMFDAVVEFADGWMPIGGAGVRQAMPVLQEAWDSAGREGKPTIIPFGAYPDMGKLEYYAELGCDEVVLDVEALPRDGVLAILDSFADFVAAFPAGSA